MKRIAIAVALAGCSQVAAQEPSPDAAHVAATPDAPRPVDAAAATIEPLEIRAFGVQGFALRYGGDVVMSAPLFTRQSTIEVGLNLPIAPDLAAIDAGLAAVPLDQLRAIISGHAHYDHFLDVPRLLEHSSAVAYSNMTGRHVLAALAPDRAAQCTSPAASPVIARDRVIALDDPLASVVDYTNCPDQRPPGAPVEGTWVRVPNSHVRVMAFCSMHPAQVGPYHFGAGSIDEDQCDLPAPASAWLEGQTLSFLIDFLDPDDRPVYRVFYQDAPTNAPIGLVTPAALAGKTVDVALLCVGTYDAVANQPTDTLANVTPRFALSGHWEDFFQPADQAPQPIPFLDLPTYTARAEAALPGPPDAPLVVDGAPQATRHIVVQPHTVFRVPHRD